MKNFLHGRVIATHGRHCFVELEDGRNIKCFPRGKRSDVTVGDYVQVQAQGQDEGSIERIDERRNLFFRSDEFRSKQFAANIDQLLIVVAPEPEFSEDLLGRALTAAWAAAIQPFIVLNKIDLTTHLERARAKLAPLVELGVSILELSALDINRSASLLQPILLDKTTLLLGQSGMGKSTLLNALVPEAQAHTQEHSQALGTGRHTTTSTRLYHVPGITGSIIDSPGFQAFGLSHLELDDIIRGFPEFHTAMQEQACRFYNCTHRHEPGCGIQHALQTGKIDKERYALYQRLLSEHEQKSRH